MSETKVISGLQEFLTMLARMGAVIDIENEAGETPLRCALRGRVEVMFSDLALV
jgi:hypothetical protein